MIFIKAFVVGGLICVLGQILINLTKMTSARILVTFLVAGIILEAIGAFTPLVEFAGAGATVPICGFGSLLASGAIEGSKEGIVGAISGGVKAAAFGLSSAIFFGYLNAIIFKPHTKKQDIKRVRKSNKMTPTRGDLKETKK